jgi:hypothetical protein
LACLWRSLSTSHATAPRSFILESAQHELQHFRFHCSCADYLSFSAALSLVSLSLCSSLSSLSLCGSLSRLSLPLSLSASHSVELLASASARISLGFIGAVVRSRPRPATIACATTVCSRERGTRFARAAVYCFEVSATSRPLVVCWCLRQSHQYVFLS